MRETPSSVEVKGTDGDLGHTGRGLKFGRPLRRNPEGLRYCYPKNGRHVTIQWETTTTLEIGWNERGVIDDILLI
jgi:hypothetical protein